jgi:HemY protein
MIRGFLYFCLFLVVGAALYQLVSEGAGYMLIVWNKTSIEMSLWFALLCLVFILFFLWLAVTFFRGGFKGLVKAKRKVFGFGNEKAQSQTVDGLIDYIEGNWPAARKKLRRSAGKVKAPIINYLAAARSAYEMGDEQNALELLHKAETSTDRGGLAVALTQVRMQLGNKQYEQALATLERASAINAEHPDVLRLRQQVYVALKDWSSLKAILPLLAKNSIYSTEERKSLERQLYQQKLLGLLERQQQASNEDRKSALKQLWSEVPTYLQQEKALLTIYIKQLIKLGENDEAQKLLAAALEKQWLGEWVDLFGLLQCSDPVKHLKKAESWAAKHDNNANLLLALGRLCLQNKQWGRAVDYFEKSLAIESRAEVYAELARAKDFLGEKEKSAAYYKKGLLMSVGQLTQEEFLSK